MPDNPQPVYKNGHTDPTANVTNILHEAVKRQDDLRAAETIRINGLFTNIKEWFVAVDVKYQIQFSAAEKAIAIAQMAQEKLVASALEGTREAINKAELATDKRFSLLSEKIDGVQGAINKSSGFQAIYVTHSDLSSELEKLRLSFEGMLRPVVNFMNSQKGTSQGQSNMWGWVIAALAVLWAMFGQK